MKDAGPKVMTGKHYVVPIEISEIHNTCRYKKIYIYRPKKVCGLSLSLLHVIDIKS